MSTSPLALPNETEFRAYYALVFLRDHDVSRQLQTLSEDIFFSPPMIRSLRLRSLAQRSNDKFVQNNAEAAPNSFVRFFKEVQRSTTFLESCILETWFGSIRTGALKALRQALGVKALQVSQVPVPILVRMLGFDDTEQFIAFCIYLELDIIEDEAGEPKAIWFKRSVPWEGQFISHNSNKLADGYFRAGVISSSILSRHCRSKKTKPIESISSQWNACPTAASEWTSFSNAVL